MTRPRLRILLVTLPVLMAAKNFGPDITPGEFFLVIILLLLIGILFFGGPFLGYYGIISDRWWLKTVSILTLVVNVMVLVICMNIGMDLLFIILVSIWNLLTSVSFIIGLRILHLSNGKRN